MNKKEIKTVKQEAERFCKDVKITLAEEALKLELPFTNALGVALYMFVVKRKGDKRFSIVLPVESAGLIAVNNTLALLQPMLKMYGLLLSPEAVIIEDSGLPLHKRIRNMSQAIIGIDGIRRLWKVEYERNLHAESETDEPISDATNNCPSR